MVPDLYGHVEHPATTYSGRLGSVAHKRDRRPGFGNYDQDTVPGSRWKPVETLTAGFLPSATDKEGNTDANHHHHRSE